MHKVRDNLFNREAAERIFLQHDGLGHLVQNGHYPIQGFGVFGLNGGLDFVAEVDRVNQDFHLGAGREGRVFGHAQIDLFGQSGHGSFVYGSQPDIYASVAYRDLI